MPVYLGFLRAINLGAKRQFPMAGLRELLTGAGFDDVATHIQTGNIRVRSTLRSVGSVSDRLEKLFEEDRGFAVPTIVVGVPEFVAIADDVEELSAEHEPAYGHYVSLLKEAPSPGTARALEDASADGERLVVRGRAAHLLLDRPYGESRKSNAFVEKHLGVATNRNATVIRTLREKWTND